MYEVETLTFLAGEIQQATGVRTVVKGNPTFGRIALAPPTAAIEIGAIDPSPRDGTNRIGGSKLTQQWNITVFGSNEPEKVRMVGAVKDWIKNGVTHTPEGGPRISFRLATGEPHRPLTDAQAEQYGYLFVIESH